MHYSQIVYSNALLLVGSRDGNKNKLRKVADKLAPTFDFPMFTLNFNELDILVHVRILTGLRFWFASKLQRGLKFWFASKFINGLRFWLRQSFSGFEILVCVNIFNDFNFTTSFPRVLNFSFTSKFPTHFNFGLRQISSPG